FFRDPPAQPIGCMIEGLWADVDGGAPAMFGLIDQPGHARRPVAVEALPEILHIETIAEIRAEDPCGKPHALIHRIEWRPWLHPPPPATNGKGGEGEEKEQLATAGKSCAKHDPSLLPRRN